MTSANTHNYIVVGNESTHITLCRTISYVKLTGYLQVFFSCELLWQGVQESELLGRHRLARSTEGRLVVRQQSLVDKDRVVDKT